MQNDNCTDDDALLEEAVQNSEKERVERERDRTVDLQAMRKAGERCPDGHSFGTPRVGMDLDGCVPTGKQLDKFALVTCTGKRCGLGVCAGCLLGRNHLTDFVNALCQLEENEIDGVTKPLKDASGETQ